MFERVLTHLVSLAHKKEKIPEMLPLIGEYSLPSLVRLIRNQVRWFSTVGTHELFWGGPQVPTSATGWDLVQSHFQRQISTTMGTILYTIWAQAL